MYSMDSFPQIVLQPGSHILLAWVQDEEYMELISWNPIGNWETKVLADLLITEGSTASSDGEGLLYRQQCPHLQAFTAVIPTWAAGAAPLVKAAVTLERSQLCFIYTSTEDFTTEAEEKDEGYFGGAKKTSSWSPLLLKTAVHRRSMYLCPFQLDFWTIWDKNWNQTDRMQMLASLLIDQWEKKV